MPTTTKTRNRTIFPKKQLIQKASLVPDMASGELCKRHFIYFIREFWETIIYDDFVENWHIPYLAQELETVARRVAIKEPSPYDLLINIPPGTTKSTVCSVMFPVWCWINWYWMRFICASYSSPLSLEQAGLSRDIIRSNKFKRYFPDISIKYDKDAIGNYKIEKTLENGEVKLGGSRFSTSVGGTVTGFHGHINIVDDPLNPKQAVSDVQLQTANDFVESTLSTRKADKLVTPTIMIMQRLHEDDPAGNWITKKPNKIKHICLPGEINSKGYKKLVKPVENIIKYEDGLLDPVRLNNKALLDLELDLGQFGYAGQVGQNPVPPEGAWFKIDRAPMVETMPLDIYVEKIVRYWDKAGTAESEGTKGAYTAGVKMAKLKNGTFIVMDCKRGRWASEVRENTIRAVAEADGVNVHIYHEQEPGSGGKDSAYATSKNLAGFSNDPDRPTGNKEYRADPFAAAWNNGIVSVLKGEWNTDYFNELRYFPVSRYKDQVDASSGAFTKLSKGKEARVIGR